MYPDEHRAQALTEIIDPRRVDAAGLRMWIATEWVTFASSSAEPKILEASFRSGFRVRRDRHVTYQGMNADAAVRAYNEIK
jgi:hypothetical protein